MLTIINQAAENGPTSMLEWVKVDKSPVSYLLFLFVAAIDGATILCLQSWDDT